MSRLSRRAAITLLAAATLLGMAAQADELAGYHTIKLANGPTTLHLQGQELLVFRAWRENFNAHGFDAITFYLRSKDDEGKPLWTLVPLFVQQKAQESEHHDVTVSGGADCLLHDVRLLAADDGRPALLVVASRDMGDSYADQAPAHFEFYQLTENADGIPGRPSFYFKAVRTREAQASYCDVTEAFAKELHLEP